jgi:hypothetical protein
MIPAAKRAFSSVAVIVLALTAASAAQTRGEGQQPPARGGQAGRGMGRGQMPPGGITPREIQAQFDAYMIAQAETALQISEEQYPQFVRRVRALQAVRRDARIARNRLLAQLGAALRNREAVDEARLNAAMRALDEQERTAVLEIQKAFAGIDELLTPWQRGRFRVLEDQLQQKMMDMLVRARQAPRR